jgi:hypothetical protein
MELRCEKAMSISKPNQFNIMRNIRSSYVYINVHRILPAIADSCCTIESL